MMVSDRKMVATTVLKFGIREENAAVVENSSIMIKSDVLVFNKPATNMHIVERNTQ